MAYDYDNAKKRVQYLQCLIDANAVLLSAKAIPVEDAPKMTDEQIKLSAQNQILASDPSSDKAALIGHLSAAPTVDDKKLAAIGFDENECAEILVESARIYTEAVALTKPIEKIIP